METTNFEIEFSVEIASSLVFGGDGFAMWLLDGVQDPTYHNDASYLLGDVFGIKRVSCCFFFLDAVAFIECLPARSLVYIFAFFLSLSCLGFCFGLRIAHAGF